MESLGKLRKEFERWNSLAYYYQKNNYYESENKVGYKLLDYFLSCCSRYEEALNKSLWVMKLTPVGDAVPYSLKDLKDLTDESSPCLIGESMYGRLFAGFESNVLIKTWDFFVPQMPCYADHQSRFCNELELLTGESRHPCLMTLKGFCFQYMLAVVYDELPEQVLSQKLRDGSEFGWDARMKVATQLASLFAWLHERLFAFGSVTLNDIVIDKNFNIKVFDFGLLTRVGEKHNLVPTRYRSIVDAPETRFGFRTLKADVYIFGVLLVELIGDYHYYDIEKKMVFHCWILKQLQGEKRSIVDKSILQDNDELGNSITALAVKCLSEDPNARPDMKEVYAKLSNLVGTTSNKSILQDNDELANRITDVACLSEDPNARPHIEEVSANLSNLVGTTSNISIV